MTQSILMLPGDGIGPEVAAAARLCLETVASKQGFELSFDTAAFGGHGIDECGASLPDETLKKAQASDAIFLGAVGGPQWDKAPERPEQGLLAIRKILGLFANLRPLKVFSGLEHLSPLKSDYVAGADLLIVRELTGGLYFGEKREGDDVAFDGCTYSAEEVDRIARIAFEAAQRRKGRVMSVDKANVLATSRLWRKRVEAVAKDYSDVALDHMLVDAAAMKLVTHPTSFDVIVTENLFGDILSDEASVISGSIGLQGSASMGAEGPGLFEPIHGSAPDIAGQNIANPSGAIASAAMLLRHGLGQSGAADQLETALEAELKTGNPTGDLGGTAKCDEFAAKVAERIAA